MTGSSLLTSVPGSEHPNLESIADDIYCGPIYTTGTSSGVNIGGSSLVNNPKSTDLEGTQLQRNSSISYESYMRFLAPSLPFSSNNISVSSVEEGFSTMQGVPQQEVQNQGSKGAASQETTQETINSLNLQKRPRVDTRQEDIMKQQVIQHLLHRNEYLQPQGHQLQAVRQQRLTQRRSQQVQQRTQSFPGMQRAPTTSQKQKQTRQHTQQGVKLGTSVQHSLDNGICSRRLMKYLYHQRNRPTDNSIQYWRKFVKEYFSPLAKKRWCLSMYDNFGSNTTGVFSQSDMDSWQCNMCDMKSGKGFEASYEILPRIFQTKFDNNVIDELLFPDMPHESRLPSGIMVLEFAKVIHESVFEHHRVVRNGQLRVEFTPELKILSWELCARSHEEFISRRILVPQVYQLFQAAHRYQSSADESGSAGVSNRDLQVSCNMFAATSEQLAKVLELQDLNDMGFSKKYIRCFQISEVVTGMKDLIDFSQEQMMGPIESLKYYALLAGAKLQNQRLESEKLMPTHPVPAVQNNMDNALGINPGMSSHMNNSVPVGPILSSNQQYVFTLNDCQNLLRRTNSNQNVLQQELSGDVNHFKQLQSMHFQGSASSIVSNQSGICAIGHHSGQHSSNAYLLQENSLCPVQGNQHLQQHVIQQMMLQEVKNNNQGKPRRSHSAPVLCSHAASGDVSRDGSVGRTVRKESAENGLELQNMPTSVAPNSIGVPSRSNNLETAAGDTSMSADGLNSGNDLLPDLELPELDAVVQEFVQNGMFKGEGW